MTLSIKVLGFAIAFGSIMIIIFWVTNAAAPNATAQYDTAPNATAQYDTAPNATSPNATSPNATSPNATSPNATSPNAKLKVYTKVENACKPPSFCENIQDSDFLVKILTFENNQLKQKVDSFRGDEKGWVVSLFSPKESGLQYEVSLEPNRTMRGMGLKTVKLGDCHGVLEQGDSKECTIVNHLEANNLPFKLKVYTKVENACKTPSFCENIQDSDFLVKILTFENNAVKQKLPNFPGSDKGRTVYLYPSQLPPGQMPPYSEGIEYDVKQESPKVIGESEVTLRTVYYGDCESLILQNSSKTCTVTNFLVR